MREYLAGNPAKFAQAFTEKLMMYAVNRELEYFDMPQVRAVVRGAAKDQYTLSSIVQGIVRSDAFLKQGSAAPIAGRDEGGGKPVVQVSQKETIQCSSSRSISPAEPC